MAFNGPIKHGSRVTAYFKYKYGRRGHNVGMFKYGGKEGEYQQLAGNLNEDRCIYYDKKPLNHAYSACMFFI